MGSVTASREMDTKSGYVPEHGYLPVVMEGDIWTSATTVSRHQRAVSTLAHCIRGGDVSFPAPAGWPGGLVGPVAGRPGNCSGLARAGQAVDDNREDFKKSALVEALRGRLGVTPMPRISVEKECVALKKEPVTQRLLSGNSAVLYSTHRPETADKHFSEPESSFQTPCKTSLLRKKCAALKNA